MKSSSDITCGCIASFARVERRWSPDFVSPSLIDVFDFRIMLQALFERHQSLFADQASDCLHLYHPSGAASSVVSALFCRLNHNFRLPDAIFFREKGLAHTQLRIRDCCTRQTSRAGTSSVGTRTNSNSNMRTSSTKACGQSMRTSSEPEQHSRPAVSTAIPW